MACFPPVSPVAAGLGGGCSRCGQGTLFNAFPGLNDRGPRCALDVAGADAGAGPAAFVMVLVGPVAVAVADVARFVLFASMPVALAIAGGLAIVLALALLRPFKATLIALQYRHEAGAGQRQE